MVDGLVVVGSHDRFLHAVDAANGQVRWRFLAAGPIDDSSPAVSDGLIYVGTLAGTIHAVDARTGRDRLSPPPWRFDPLWSLRTPSTGCDVVERVRSRTG